MVCNFLSDPKPLHLPSRFGHLPPRWSWLRLDDACESVFDCPHSTPNLVDAGPFVVRSQDIITGVFRAEQAACVSEETYKERTSRAVPMRGDLFYSREGTYFGIAAEVPDRTRICLGQRMVLIRPKASVIDFRFLCHWLNSPIMASHIHGYRDGTVAERLNLPTIRAFPVLVPPLHEQRVIAHILGTLDDKIELNRRTNETLEAIAGALFKSWIVDFDPVHAKFEGRDPGLSKPLADLFPDSFEDSELGEIPKGWEVQRFADTVDIIGGGTPKTSMAEYWNGDIPWFSVVDSPSNSEVWVIDTGKKITHEGVENSSARVLSVGTTIISARGTVGRIALVAVPMAMNQSCYGLRGKAGTYGFFTYFSTRELVTRLQQHAHGSVFDTITKDTLAGVSLVLPPAALIEVFEARVGPTLERIRANLLGSRTLAALRDTLLSKLISGELPINAAEQFTKESTI